MKDIVDCKYIKSNQDEILKLGDVVPVCVFKHMSKSKIEDYYEYNSKNISWFLEEFKTLDDWLNSELNLRYINSPEVEIELLNDWVECYPQFKDMLNEEYFDEYIENDGVFDYSDELGKIENRFHKLIMQRAGHLIKEYDIEMPHITIDLVDKAKDFNRESFQVPGMYGGFYYILTVEDGEFVLDVKSWSRVVEGSGQSHIITTDKCELTSEGFV